MSREQIKQLVESRISDNGIIETGVEGVKLFKSTEPIRCAPALYEPSVTVILNGNKEAIWGGKRQQFDSHHYLCCNMSMPIEAGAPDASPEKPLLGVYISLDNRPVTELAIEMERTLGVSRKSPNRQAFHGIALSKWDDNFSDALLRILQLGDDPTDTRILSDTRLREFYYSVFKGGAGCVARAAFGVGNQIAKSIEFLSHRLQENITIEDMADRVGMSRAVFHRKFKEATSMSPIQFIKSMRLNNAAMKIASGTNVNVAAADVGYVSSSQFSREFKRMYGLSPKQWGSSHRNVQRVVA